VLGGFVRIAEVETVLVQPAAHVGLMDEVEVQPVVAQPAGAGNAAVITRLIA
jgi:hypothetical protein